MRYNRLRRRIYEATGLPADGDSEDDDNGTSGDWNDISDEQ